MDDVSPAMRVFGEMIYARVQEVIDEIGRKAREIPDAGNVAWQVENILLQALPRTTKDKTGRVGIIDHMTPNEVRMAVTLQESKDFKAPVFYSRMLLASANRIKRNMLKDDHIWYGCELTKESAEDAPGMVDVYLDATPIMALD